MSRTEEKKTTNAKHLTGCISLTVPLTGVSVPGGGAALRVIELSAVTTALPAIAAEKQ